MEQKLKLKPIGDIIAENNLSPDWCGDFRAKLTDPDTYEQALRMYADGIIPYDVANGTKKIDAHKIMFAHQCEIARRQKRVADYLNVECRRVDYRPKGAKHVHFAAFIDGDDRLVALSKFVGKKGGIYASNNDVTGVFNWNDPKRLLRELRDMNRAFFRQIRAAAMGSPEWWFDVTNKPIVKQ